MFPSVRCDVACVFSLFAVSEPVSLKQNLLKGAMKAMTNPTVQKIISNEKTQKAFAQAFKTSYALKSQLDDTKADVAKRLNLATSDDLRSMKRELDRLQRQVERLKKEKQAREAEQNGDA